MSEAIFIAILFGSLYMVATNFQMELVRNERNYRKKFLNKLSSFNQMLQVIKEGSINIVFLILVVLMSTGNVFFYCFIGTFTTAQFFNFGDITYESMWYKFPVRLQKYLPMIIENAHIPCIYNGNNIIDLNLMTFAKVNSKSTLSHILTIQLFQVLKTVFSYHLMLKKTAR